MPPVSVPGAPSMGGQGGLNVPGLNLGPYIAAPAGGATAGALRIGYENAAAIFSGISTGGQYLTAQSGMIGSNGYRAVTFTLPNMPTSGDCYTGLFFRTAPSGLPSTSLSQTLLAVSTFSQTSGSGGGVSFIDPGAFTGSDTTGEEISNLAGYISVARNASGGAWHMFGGANAGIVTSAASPFVPVLVDTEYLLIVGISGTNGAIILVDVAAGVATALTSALSGTRPASTPMFNQIGAVGTASLTTASVGFGGSVSDLFYVAGTFPTTSQAQAIASGATAIGGITGLGYYNTLDGSTISGGAIPAVVGGAATVVGSNLIGAAPIRKPSNIKINRLGAHWVFPLACGATSGNAWIEGTAPVGAVVNCQLIYAGSGSSAVVQVTADGAGRFNAAINSPGNRPFYRRAWAANGDPLNTFTDLDIMDVGIVVQVFGQSECNIMPSSAGTMATGSSSTPPTPVANGNAGMTLPMPGSYAGPWACYLDTILHVPGTSAGYSQTRGNAAKARPEIMLGWGYPGDGLNQAAISTIARTGYSCMFVFLTRSGHNMDSFLLDGQTFTKTITLASNAGTLGVVSADVNAKFGTTNYILYTAWTNGVRPGSVTLTWANGGSPVTIPDSGYTYSDASTVPTGTFTGSGFSGTINYFTGAISFTGTLPTGVLTATWTIKQETQNTTYNNKTGLINGYGVREALDRVGSVGLRYGASVIWTYWITANITDSTTPSILALNLVDKYPLLRCMAYGLATPNGSKPWPGYLGSGLALGSGVSNPPMIVAPKGHETSSVLGNVYGTPDGARIAQSSLWPGALNAVANVLQGSWYYDDAVDVIGSPGSPHEDHSVQGAQRIGRRWAADIAAAITINPALIDAPTWGTPVFSGGVAGARTVITIPLSAAWRARNPTLTLSVALGGNANTLDEWYVGGTYSYSSNSNAAGTLVDNNTYATAALAANGLSVVITAAGSTTWNDASPPLVRYVMGAPGQMSSALPQSLLYDNRGGFGANEPGLLASPKFS